MARTDIARMLTGVGGPAPVQAMPGTAGFAGQFGAQTTAGMGQAIGALTRGGAPSYEETVAQTMGQLDITKVEDLAKLAKIQQVRNDLAGAAQTASKIQAIRERERLIKENEKQKLLDEQNRTTQEEENARRWEAEQKLREQRLELQRQKLAQEGQAGTIKLLKDDKEAIRSYVDQASNSSGEAYSALSLADRYAAMSPTGGVVGRAYGAFKSLLGAQTEIDSLKTEFTRLTNTGIINSLPPGVASDRDISLISKGFPDSSWSPKEIERFLRAVAKVSAYDAERNSFRAKYAEERGGVETGFTDAWREKINEPGYKESVAGRYGFEYDIPTKQEVFDADEMARIKAQSEQENIANYGREFSTPDLSALTN